MDKIVSLLMNYLELNAEQATDRLIITLGVFTGSFLALCLFGIIYGLIASTRY